MPFWIAGNRRQTDKTSCSVPWNRCYRGKTRELTLPSPNQSTCCRLKIRAASSVMLRVVRGWVFNSPSAVITPAIGKLMFWPAVLPAEIAFWALATVVVFVTAVAPSLKRRRVRTFWVASSLAIAAFIPSCTGIMFVVDGFRFGDFEYTTFEEIKDFRAQRYLPTACSDISMRKQASGYRARYSISSDEFHVYLDNLWQEYGEYSAVKRGDMSGEGSPASEEEQRAFFAELGWRPLEHAIVYHSPSESDGGGAVYYFDSIAGVAMQRTGYW